MRTAARSTTPFINLSLVPRFPITNEHAFARQGFLEYDHFEELVSKLPAYLHPITVVGYNTGIRKGELQRIQWDQVDFENRLIRLYRGKTKGGEPRTVPMIDDMYHVLFKAKEERDKLWPECRRAFHRLGSPLKDFRELGIRPANEPVCPVCSSTI